jgi:hypothetical protein
MRTMDFPASSDVERGGIGKEKQLESANENLGQDMHERNGAA